MNQSQNGSQAALALVQACLGESIEAHGRAGDLAIALSTSGRSPNVLAAVSAAGERGLFTVGLTGQDGGPLAERVDLAIRVPSTETPRIQESHIAICHAICEVVEEGFRV